VVELVVADMAASLAFYARLGLAAPEGTATEATSRWIRPAV
jgi:hypothetical protein